MSKAKVKYLEVNTGTPPNPMNFKGIRVARSL